jgi:transcriptional regulator with XRE-family HTH domain
MAEIAQSININLAAKLKDKEYRRKFFWAESCTRVAEQLVALRKRRGLNQTQVADLIGTKQPAISRAEQADYQSLNLGTVRKIADRLDARLRVYIEPAEDVLCEYEDDNDNSKIIDTFEAAAADASGNVPSDHREIIRDSALAAYSRGPRTQTPPQLASPEPAVGSAEVEELRH